MTSTGQTSHLRCVHTSNFAAHVLQSHRLHVQGVWASRRCKSVTLLEGFRLVPLATPPSGGTCEALAYAVCIPPAPRNLQRHCLGQAAAASRMSRSTPLHPLVSAYTHAMCDILSARSVEPVQCLQCLPAHAGMVAASLAALMHGGALVEVGKRGIWSPARVAQDRPDAAYHLVAIDFWRPATVAASLLDLATSSAQGVCFPLA